MVLIIVVLSPELRKFVDFRLWNLTIYSIEKYIEKERKGD